MNYNQQYYQQHAEKIREQKKAYYEKKKAGISEKRRKYYLDMKRNIIRELLGI